MFNCEIVLLLKLTVLNTEYNKYVELLQSGLCSDVVTLEVSAFSSL